MTQKIAVIILCFFTLVGTVNAKSSRPGPMPESPIIAQVRRQALFIPEGYPNLLEIKVRADGKVMAWITYPDFVQVTQIATLAPIVIAKLQTAVSAAKAEKLEDIDPDTPICMDAPSTRFEAFPKPGKTVVLAKNEECKQYRKPNGTQEDYEIIVILESLLAIGDLLPERL